MASKLLPQGRPTKNVLRKIASDVNIVKERLVDAPAEKPGGVIPAPATRPMAKTANLDAFLATDGRTIQIVRAGKVIIEIKMKDIPEYRRLIAKVEGLAELRKTVPLYGELEPPRQ